MRFFMVGTRYTGRSVKIHSDSDVLRLDLLQLRLSGCITRFMILLLSCIIGIHPRRKITPTS